MRKWGVGIVALAMLAMLAMPRQAAAEDKGILALQQSVSLLLSQLQDLQKSFNQQIGMIQGLVSQNTDTVNKLSSALTSIQHTLSGDQLIAAQHQTSISQQFQSVSDSISALQARLKEMDLTLQQVHQMQQTIPPPAVAATSAATNPSVAPGAAPGAAPGSDAMPANSGASGTANTASAAPSPMQLYQQALNDFQSGDPQAQVELASFIRNYPNDPQVPNATYFLGSVFMQKGQYNEAITQFNNLITYYPDNAKTPLAELNKGLSLLKQGQRDDAISEFRALSKNYPGTAAARQADDELHRLEPHRRS
ncbi:MAG: tetratricopeptide repeat protein [Terriglobales bacterium]